MFFVIFTCKKQHLCFLLFLHVKNIKFNFLHVKKHKIYVFWYFICKKHKIMFFVIFTCKKHKIYVFCYFYM